ncbi:MAG: hypothetical protein E6G39_12365 [Actinobacteria bacterium]|nr:MAG: hypothetical protein E6G39_12365 [Actinomycetota bacterium]
MEARPSRVRTALLRGGAVILVLLVGGCSNATRGAAPSVTSIVGTTASTAPSPSRTREASLAPIAAIPTQWQSLERPLQLPPLTTSECPVSSSSVIGRNRARGDGPVRLLAEGNPHALAVFSGSSNISSFPMVKVYWLSQPGLTADVLLRGQNLRDGSPMMFEDVEQHSPWPARRWLVLHPSVVSGGIASTDWDVTAHLAWVTVPGCYGLQLDSAAFSIVIVTEVR